MEFVEGTSLSDFLRKGPIAVDQLRVLQKRLAAGLQAAHELGIIHRDVSPDNIILPGENLARAKIIDFGIARSTQGEGTVIGSGFAGKFSYVSPEQLGLFGGDVGPASDIYSLGLVLAEAALGKAIDMGHSHVDVIDKRRRVPDLSGVDAKVRPLLTAMLQPNPKDRPASMAEVADWQAGGRRREGGGGGGRALGLAAAVAIVAGGLGGAGWFFLPQIQATLAGLGAATTSQVASGPEVAASRAPPSEGLLPDAPPPAQAPPGPSSPPPQSAGVPPAAAPLADPTPAAPAEPAIAALPPPVPVPVPAIEPEPAALPPGTVASVEQVTRFVQGYAGGECFYVTPLQLAVRDAKIEAFGASPSPFIAFDSAFQRAMGFEPEISLRQITRDQCPAVEFMARRAGQAGTRPPRLTLRADRIRSGQELQGVVESRGDPNLDVVLVDSEGLVHSLSPYLKRSGERADFSLKLEGSGQAEKAQLVVAVSSNRPLPALRSGTPMRADRYFRQLAEETRGGAPVNVAAGYFKLGG
jgi:hypothetical protein